MLIEIKALDTLFFRDGKPFTMGENHWTDSLFPPNMSTIYGAIRTAYFMQNMEVFEKLRMNNELNTEKDPTRKLEIKRLIYRINKGDNSGFYYSMPLDLVALKNKSEEEKKQEDKNNKYKVHQLKVKENNYISSNPLKYLLYFDHQVENISDGILNKYQMENYIKGKTEGIEACKISDYLESEPKIGIGIDKELGTSKESRLYRIDLKRLKDISLIVEFEGIEIYETGLLRLGGEGKYVTYEECSKFEDISNPFNVELQSIDNKFRLSLLTPAIFENGWLPKGFNKEDKFIYENEKFKVRLVAAVVGKHTLIGGYDMAKNRPKPMLKAVPAGATYYFEILDGDVKDIIDQFQMKSISDFSKKEGYGLGFISKWGD